jgi:RNA polymerase sigma-70 factor (ECF subfamily)
MADADERLLVEAAQRDPSRFADLYERHFERVYAFVVRRVRERDAAEELTAEVFHRALAHLPTFRPRGAPFGAWLFSIARNALIDRAKLGAREVVDSERLPDRGADPDADEELDRVEALARLFRFVDELPADQRTVIVDRFVDERSIRDTAARLGRSEGAIKQLQVRALETLRKRMHRSAERRDG